MKKVRKTALGSVVVGIFILFGSLSANAGICLTFDTIGDTFKGEIIASKGNYHTIALVETAYNRAAFGSAYQASDKFYVGFTKNTTAANVEFQCEVSSSTLQGTCNIGTLWFDDGSIQLTTANITITGCTADRLPDNGLRVTGE